MAKPLTKAQKLKRQGIYYFCGGLIITLATMALAENGGGGTYILAWGPILFGPVIYLRGVMLAGGPEDVPEVEGPPAINPADNKCPSCATPYSSTQSYCSLCGRYLKI